MAKVCISGHYGYGCIENELMLMSLVGALRHLDENMEISVFSANVAQTEADYDVIALGRDHSEELRKELRGADLLIVGGGHLLKETEDLADIKYYLKLIKMAQRMDVPVFLYHQSFEPFSNSRVRMMVAKVLQKVRKITVADAADVEILHEMGIRRGRIHVMTDPILALREVEEVWEVSEAAETEQVSQKAMAEAEAWKAKEQEAASVENAINYDGMDLEIEIRIVEKEEPKPAVDPEHTIVIGDLADAVISEAADEGAAAVVEAPKAAKPAKPVSNRPENLAAMAPSFWKKPGEKYAAFVVSPKAELPVAQITAMADHMVESGYQVVFLPLHYENDAALAKNIMNKMQHPSYIVDAKMSAPSFCTAVKAVDFVFSTELQALMVAALCKKPLTALCCSEKALEWMVALGLAPTGNLLDLNVDAFVFQFKAAVADSGAVVKALEENLPALQEKAMEGEEQLAMIFEQIARKKARTARASAPRSEAAAPVSGELNEADVALETETAADIVTAECEGSPAEALKAENAGDDIAEAPAEGYVRRSRRSGRAASADNDGLAVAMDKAKDFFGGFGEKLKNMTAGKSSHRSDDDYLTDEATVSEAEAEVTEEKEA